MEIIFTSSNGTVIKMRELSQNWKDKASKVIDLTTLTKFMIDLIACNYECFENAKEWFFDNPYYYKQSDKKSQHFYFDTTYRNVSNNWNVPPISFDNICDRIGGIEIDKEIWNASRDPIFVDWFLGNMFPNLPDYHVSSLILPAISNSVYGLVDNTEGNNFDIFKRDCMYEGGLWVKYHNEIYAPIFAVSDIYFNDDNDTFYPLFDIIEKPKSTENKNEDAIKKEPVVSINCIPEVIKNSMKISFKKQL